MSGLLPNSVKNLLKNKHFKYGLPFFLFILFGHYVVNQTQSARYTFTKTSTLKKDDFKEYGIRMKEKPETLEEVYEQFKKIDIDNWENIRGPRLVMELICAAQNYHWGKKGMSSLVAQYVLANSGTIVNENQTYAEFWMGTHPNGSSYLKNEKLDLAEYLKNNLHELGAETVKMFGEKLPFLFKILSVEIPLSIQAHPTKSHAEQLFKNRPDLYKDENHKPELAVAITEFEALCGFRPYNEIKHFLKNIPEFKLLIDPSKIEAFLQVSGDNKDDTILMKDCFKSLMLCDEKIISSALDKLMDRLNKFSSAEQKEYLADLVKRVHSSFPKDVGVFCVYWLNYLVLSPGEALYLAPNEPHAYLYGDCLECMANSDNVVRAGLTPKFRDIPTLCEMLSYKNYKPSDILFHPDREDDFCQVYSPPVNDFAVAKIVLPKNCSYNLKKRKSASILIVTEGEGELNMINLYFGKVLYIPCMYDCLIKSNGIVLFQAFCNI